MEVWAWRGRYTDLQTVFAKFTLLLYEIGVGKLVWLATDEWTDSLGHAMINILVGCSGEMFGRKKTRCTGVCVQMLDQAPGPRTQLSGGAQHKI